MFKNVASQKVTVFAFDATTNLPKTGDAGNLTAYVSKDDGTVTVLGDTSATEQDATNAKGYYIFDLTQAETNADKLMFSAKSSTSNIVVIAVPAVIYTVPPNFSSALINSSGKTSPADGSIAAATFAASAIDSSALATSAVNEIVDQVWDELLSGHVGAGSAGAALTAAGSAGDPWSTPLPGAYSSGTAGFIIGTNLDDAISAVLAAIGAIPTAGENATELLDQAAGVETNRTVRQGLRLILAAVAGRLSGAATTVITIRDTNNTVDRIVATVDSNGNRSAITYNAS